MPTACLGVALFAVMASAPPPSPGAVAVVSSHASATVATRVLDLAFVQDDRLAVLLEDGVELYQREGGSLRRTDHRPIESSIVVRARAGIIVAEAGAFWVSTNIADGAVLFTTDGGRLQETQRAAALPFPGSPQGARFHPDTNLVEVTVAGLGNGLYLRVGGGETPWAIAPDGRFGAAGTGWTHTRVGSAAALLWPGRWIASSAEPPGAGDALSIVESDSSTVVATFPAPASVTAIGAHTRGDRAFVATAIAEGERHRLVLLELARDRP